MLTSKQRAKLKSIATATETILQVGKGGVGEQLVVQVNDALVAREIVKLHVLETAPESCKDLATQLAEATHSEVVQIIGRRIVLFRRNDKNPVIELGDKKKKTSDAKKSGEKKPSDTKKLSGTKKLSYNRKLSGTKKLSEKRKK